MNPQAECVASDDSQLGGEVTIHTLGDSHCQAGFAAVSVPGVRIVSHHVGPKLMHSVARDGLWIDFPLAGDDWLVLALVIGPQGGNAIKEWDGAWRQRFSGKMPFDCSPSSSILPHCFLVHNVLYDW